MVDISIFSKRIFDNLVRSKWRFAFSFIVIFFITFSLLTILGFTPEVVEKDGSLKESKDKVSEVGADPIRIVIPSVGIDANIVNPESRDLTLLDRALKDGVVHYPGSGTLEEEANVFLFGHSSFLPIVRNESYKVFNNLERLRIGDIIKVESNEKEYVYKVEVVRLTDAGEAFVDLRKGNKKLTLSTCNSFGSVDERFVVEANFVESHLL
ncbi:MAG: sortase [Parcubacteria group bacterium]|nr:sortase [Parcubacteria group bacterium]